MRFLSGLAILLGVCACSSQTQATTAPASAETKVALNDDAHVEIDKPTLKKPTKDEKRGAADLVERGRAILKEQGKTGAPAAIALFTQAINENPRNADAYWELGWAQQIAGDFDSGLQTWHTLASLYPQYPNLDSFAAVALIRRGEQAPQPPPAPKKAPPRRHDMKADLAR